MKALAVEGRITDEDVRWLAEQAKTRHVIVEIGPYKGRSTRALADATPGVVYAIDNWTATLEDGRPDRTAKPAFYRNCRDLLSEKVIVIEQDSRLGVPDVLRDASVDMLWIDGDHAYETVRSDLALFAPLVRPGGLICGHDYSVWHPEVVRAVDDAFGPDRIQTISIHRSIWWVTA